MKLSVVAHLFNPSTPEAGAVKVGLVYSANSKTARATNRSPASKNKTEQKKKLLYLRSPESKIEGQS